MKQTKYEQFIDEMEKNGFRKIHSELDEIYATLSDNDDIISIAALDCHMISIKGIKESTTADKKETIPHSLHMKIYGYDGKELEPNDIIQFGIVVELTHKGLPTMKSDKNYCIYYHYPYRAISSKIGIKFKKGISITKDKRLEMKIFRSSSLLKIGKFEMNLECDKWFKIDEKRENKFDGREKIDGFDTTVGGFGVA